MSKASKKTDEGRRGAIKKLGGYGACTAPALMVMLRSGKHLRSREKFDCSADAAIVFVADG